MGKKFKVTNRSMGHVVYTVQLDNGAKVRREFDKGQTREIEEEELNHLLWSQGGPALVMRYLLLEDEDKVKEISNNKVEPEYWMREADVKTMLQSGTLDQLIDCLNFAPEGVLDLVKKWAVDLPVNDMQKRQAILDKMGFDVTEALRVKKESEEPDDNNVQEIKEEAPVRRTTPAGPVRKTTPNYKVIKAGE